MRKLITSSLTMILVGLSFTASAGMGCNSDAEGKVDNDGIPNDGSPIVYYSCETGSTGNDSVYQINADSMFDSTDWMFAEKYEFDPAPLEEEIDVGLIVSGNAQAGLWNLATDIWQTYSEIMIVLKGSAKKNTNPNYLGYMVASGDVAGSYETPFFGTKNNKAKDISHISIYVRAVPEPGSLVLLALGLGLICLMRRRVI